MRILKSLCIAFSIYSKIPVPQFAWEEDDMKYMMCFFPWIGAVIGGILYLWFLFSEKTGVGRFATTLIAAVIPLLVTGGFHVDGFMDTMDALHSYQPREKKLEILKDPHIGAFSVIMLAVYGMVFLAALSELCDMTLRRIFCAGFFLSRTLSGIGVMHFPSAKKNGLLFSFADSAKKRRVMHALYVQCAAVIGFMLVQSIGAGLLAAGSAFGAFFYYRWKSEKEFGGITGDTAGFFVCICELFVMVALAIVNVMM